MSELLIPIVDRVVELLQNFGFLAGMLLIICESMVPVLPLGLFVAFNFSAYGFVLGFLISYFSTIVGCIIAYFLSNKLLSVYVDKKSKEHEKVKSMVNKFREIKFANLVLITALPFSPAFLINISSGIAKINLKKFIAALFVAKISIVYFWGMVGKSFIESIGDINTMLIILLLLGGCYLISKLVAKKMNLE